MSSSSAWTDIEPERVLARELHFLHQQSTSPVPRPRQYSAELSSIGSHFPHAEAEHWPEVLNDFAEEESASQSLPMTPKRTRAAPDRAANPNGHGLQGSPPTPASTPPRTGAYLAPEEYSEFLRRRSSQATLRNRRDRSSDVSPSRRPMANEVPIPYRTRRGEIPEGSQQGRTAFSTRETVPPSSVYTFDGDDGADLVVDEPAAFDGPWSPMGVVYAEESADEQCPEYTEYRGRS